MKRIISIHFGDELDIALNDKHIWLVKNCKILSEPIEEEGVVRNRTQSAMGSKVWNRQG